MATDLASLRLDIDSTSVKEGVGELDRLTAAGTKAEGATKGFGLSADQAERYMRKASIALGDMKAKEDAVAASATKAGAAATKMARDAQAAAAGLNKLGANGKLASHHMANLGFQINDVVQGFAMGQAPMQIFMQQGFQIGQIAGQAGVGIGGLAKAVGGMIGRFVVAHPLLVGLGAAAGAGALGFKLLAEQVNTQHQAELDAYTRSLGLTAEQIEEAGGAAVTAGDLIGGLWDVIREALGLEDIFASLKKWMMDTFTAAALNAKKNISEIYAAVAAAVDAIRATWGNVGAILGDAVISGVNIAIGAIENLVNRASVAVGALVSNINPILSPLGKAIGAVGGSVKLGRVDNPYAGAGANAADAFASAYAKRLGAAHGWFDDTYSSVIEAGLERTKGRLSKAAEESGKKIGSHAGKAMGKQAAVDFGMTFAEAFKDLADEGKLIDRMIADKAKIAENIEGLEREAKAIGLVGWERERLLTILDATAEIQTLQSQLEQASNQNIADQLREKIALKEKELQLTLANGDAEEAWHSSERAARSYNNSLVDIIASLQSIGGFGGVIGGLLGVLSGNTGAVRGPVGDLLNIGIAIDPVTKEVRRLGDVLKGAVGELGGKLTGALQNAGIGVMAGSAILGKQGTKGMIGGAVGGILGSIGGSALAGTITAAATSALGGTIGAALGSAVPVIGTILGGLAGTALASLLGGTKRGSAILTGSGVSGFYGNNAGFKDQAGDLGGGIMEALSGIAAQLGGTIDPTTGKVSIGVRNGKYAVDTQGRGYTKSSIAGVQSFGTDQEAAVRAAIMDLINDGVITGLRDGTMKLLQSGGDLEAQLQKALAFENVFRDLEASANPFKAQLEALKTQFDQLKQVFAEAGASAADYAQLQTYIAKQQAAIVDQASANYRSTFYTDSQNTTYAKQQIAGVLGPMGYGSVDTVREYKALVEATDALANPELYGALMGLVDAFGTLKDAEDAARAASQAAAAQKAAEAAQAKSDAESALRQAYGRESSALQQTIDRFNGFADTLSAFRKEILAGDNATSSYAMRLAELRRVGALAGMGDEAAIGALPGAGRDFLSAAKNQAGSPIEYQRAVALVARYAGTAEQASRGMATEAQKQLDAINKQVGAMIDLTDGVLSLTDAIKQFAGAGAGSTSASTPADRARKGELLQARADRQQQRAEERAARLEDYREQRAARNDTPPASTTQTEQRLANQEAALTSLARSSAEQAAFFKRLSPDGLSLRIVTDGVPLEVAS